MSVTPTQANEWIKNLSNNMRAFRKKARMKKEDKVKFINEQYLSLHLLNRAIYGHVQFIGCPKPVIEEDKNT